MKLSRKFLQKHSQAEKLYFTPEDIRWATPEIAADYRAERLAETEKPPSKITAGRIIADIGCGIGFQTFAFAKVCPKVYAIDIDKQKLDYAKKNAEILGFKNITFIQGDALDKKIISKLKEAKVDVVFCDPQRLPGETERSVASIVPDIPKLLDLYSSVTDKIAVEFPPQIKNIPFDCEKEYLSIDKQLNRLTLYFGSLKKCESSAVILPERAILRSNPKPAKKELKLAATEKLGKFLYEADPAVVKAGLLSELSALTKTLLFSKGKAVFFTADSNISSITSPFFKKSFCILDVISFDEKQILKRLQQENIGKIILRYELEPKEYWAVRSRYESQLAGEKKGYLFKFGGKAVIGIAC